MQYGKLISYWNCKIINTSDAKAVQCDCEKILIDTTGDENATILVHMHVKDKIEEWFNFYKVPSVPENSFSFSKINPCIILNSPSAGFTGYVFQPPKFS